MKKVTLLLAPALLLPLLACDEGLEPVPFQGVSGAVAYSGALPDSTEWVRIAAFTNLPESEIDLLNFSAISNELIPLEDSARYVVDLDTGLYRWLPVVWKKVGAPLSPDALLILGWYTDGSGPFDTPQPVSVEADSETGAIELVADYDNAMTIEEALEAIR